MSYKNIEKPTLVVDFLNSNHMDNRKDYARFEKAFAIVQKKMEKSPLSNDDMESFLNGCIKPEQIKTLLEDGRISTLTKVFVEFFSNAIDQYSEIAKIYAGVADTMVGMKNRTDVVVEEYQDISANIEELSLNKAGNSDVS